MKVIAEIKIGTRTVIGYPPPPMVRYRAERLRER
jgi:hypothetical protein